MKIMIHKDDTSFINAFFDDDLAAIEPGSRHAVQIDRALQIAIQQKNLESNADGKRTLGFMLLFLFLYAALGASLTLDLTSSRPGHKSIEYALEAIPVLIAFSGFFISILFLFSVRAGARKRQNWEKSIHLLEKYSTGNLFKLTHTQGAGTSNYSLSAISLALSLFICLTWLIIYNYLTFTTSGVFGSVISLFISTMVYVILDIQLLKPFLHSGDTAPADKDVKDKDCTPEE